MIILAVLGILMPLFFGYGISLFFLRKSNIYERLVISASLGIGILCYILFILNQALGIKLDFLASIIILLVLLIAGAVFTWINKKRLAKKTRKARADEVQANESPIYKHRTRANFKVFFKENLFLKILLLAFIIIILYKALLFPIADGDAIVMHGPMVKSIVKTGDLPTDVGPSTNEFTQANPVFFKAFGAWMIILNNTYNDIFIRLMLPFFGILTMITTYALAMSIFHDKRKSLLGVLLLLSFPAFSYFIVLVTEDVMFAFFSVVGVYLIIRYFQSKEASREEPSYFVLGLVNLAFSTQVKHLGLPLSLGVIIALLFILYYKRIMLSFKGKSNEMNNDERGDRLVGLGRGGLKKAIKNAAKSVIESKETKLLLIGLILMIIIAAPFFIRNAIVFKDPMYPYLSYKWPYLPGKNFVAFQFEHMELAMESAKLPYAIHHPEYFLFGLANFVREKVYSMSVFFIFLFILVLCNFKKLKREQKYLLYFSIFYTLYYAWSFLLKYRYYLGIIPLLCVVAADQFDNLLKLGLSKKQKIFFLASAATVILGIVAYLALVRYKDIISHLLGNEAGYFLSQVDITIMLNLIAPLIAIAIILTLRNPKIKTALVLLILLVPSMFGLAFVRTALLYTYTTETIGFIDSTPQDLELFRKEVLKPIPSKEAILKLYFGNYSDAMRFMNNNLSKDSVILTYEGGASYYVDPTMIPIDSYRAAKTYNATLSQALAALREQNITHVLYKIPGRVEILFGNDLLYQKSTITQNLNNSSVFKEIYNDQKEFIMYKINYP